MKIKRRDKRIWFVLLGVFMAVFLFTFLAKKFKDNNVEAANLANFDPGYIISDYQMGNYNSMSEADIQRFLSSKVSCDKDQSFYNYLTSHYSGYSWHFANGHIVCLPEERFGNSETIGSGETAAHIIWQAAQDYRINPQVLIVLLQKEQGLITDKYPNTRQYRSATGYGCPDTAACSSKYYGFKNQVRNAAALFRSVLDGGWTNYPLGNNYVKYNPNAACGGSVVNIRSLATSALYRYTPYQPNASALAAGYGSGDGCGAYGNRNFYLYFEDWFGGIKEEKYKEPIVEAKTKFEHTVIDGTYQIASKAFPDKVVDIKGGAKDGVLSAPLQTYARKTTNVKNQIFEIKYDKTNGYYSITNPATGLAIDVKGAKTDNSTPTQVYSSHDKCNQDWLFEKDDKGYYTIISRCSSKVLDASLSTSAVNIFSNHNGDNQKWRLERNN